MFKKLLILGMLVTSLFGSVRELTDAGRPIVDSLPSGSAAQAYMQLSANLDERISENLASGLAEPIFSVTED